MSEIPSTTYVYPEPSAYAVIESDTINHFSKLLKIPRDEVYNIVIVGAYWGLEILHFLSNYPNAHIYAFEAHPEHFKRLSEWRNNPQVTVYNLAIASEEKEITFNEISLPGSGSIFEYQGDKFGDDKKICQRIKMVAKPLSSIPELKGKIIDLLWVDVQGAELEVLKGTDLNSVRSMFLEVKTRQHVKPWDAEPYKGQCFLSDLLDYLPTFQLVSIGLDNENKNGSGNSFWIAKKYMPKLSILICSLNGRAKYLERLKKILGLQIFKYINEVEVLVSCDNGERSIGAKRDALIRKATGEYVAFIDDDDTVSGDYIEKILQAIETKPDVVGMCLLMYTDGVNPQLSTHSLKYTTWWDEPDPAKPGNKRYYRNPNHLNPVKREHAIKAGFPDISMCEDRRYSADILPFLKTEVYIESPIYNYLVRSHKEC